MLDDEGIALFRERTERLAANSPPLFDMQTLHEIGAWLNAMTCDQRKQLWRPRMAKIIYDAVMQQSDHRIREKCWDILAISIRRGDRIQDEPTAEEVDAMNFGVELGIVEAVVFEIERTENRDQEVIAAALVPCTFICLNGRFAERVLKANLIPSLVRLVWVTNENAVCSQLALIALTNIALHPITHDQLRENRVVELATNYLTFLNALDLVQLDYGLSAAFLICRIAGRDHEGVGMASIHSNSLLITQRLKWLLENVLAAGPEGIFLGSHWNPANIVHDVSIIAQSDQNKHLLSSFVPAMITALELRGESNLRLVKYTISALVDLYAEDECRQMIQHYKPNLLRVLHSLPQERVDIRTYQGIKVLETELASHRPSIQNNVRSLWVRFHRRIQEFVGDDFI